MKINEKILSIPPYISTTWNNILSLQMKENILLVGLKNGESIKIPNLDPELIDLVFEAHVSYMDRATQAYGTNSRGDLDDAKMHNTFIQPQSQPSVNGIDVHSHVPFRLGLGSVDGLNLAMQHNPAQANMPDLPPEVLAKIGAIAKIIAPEDVLAMPKAEPNCNCMHCQIASVVHQPTKQVVENVEDEILDTELNFQQWEIVQSGENLFNVMNRLDPKEKYSVYLGNPLGCTCGKENCEHIIAVLKS